MPNRSLAKLRSTRVQSHPIVRALFFKKYRYGTKRVTQFWQSVSDTMNILYSWTSILRRLLNNTILWYHTDRGISQVSILLVSTYYVWYWNRAGTRSTKKWYTIVRAVLKMLANSSTGFQKGTDYGISFFRTASTGSISVSNVIRWDQ